MQNIVGDKLHQQLVCEKIQLIHVPNTRIPPGCKFPCMLVPAIHRLLTYIKARVSSFHDGFDLLTKPNVKLCCWSLRTSMNQFNFILLTKGFHLFVGKLFPVVCKNFSGKSIREVVVLEYFQCLICGLPFKDAV